MRRNGTATRRRRCAADPLTEILRAAAQGAADAGARAWLQGLLARGARSSGQGARTKTAAAGE